MGKSLYICIVKVDDNPDGSAKCLRYHTSNLLSFVDFLDEKWPTWRWFNVYDHKFRKGKLIANYTKNDRPAFKRISNFSSEM